jgi:hypothetical protein
VFLSNNDMYLLNEIASVLQIDNGSVSKSNVEDFVKLVEKLEEQKAKRNNLAKNYIKSKRKQDKTYGQTYERKNKILGI